MPYFLEFDTRILPLQYGQDSISICTLHTDPSLASNLILGTRL